MEYDEKFVDVSIPVATFREYAMAKPLAPPPPLTP